ncbi:Gfo/Idh/MocA family oxidoreductase [Thalassotalea litorea]|uniref:Gfo/Idh/MocA family oxidoreductase n=1 Tax=Thalassotalea litorea TaxID=2020715 RepID=A0A5R9IM48_9GAMM|nr:Gfo/Idh/MocA family oxidoreductase [Thalassotalea litorea]TLU64306.1 Gfo/Idh/MocA family oxidoreductase [Thalassotalea litorea]
MSTTTRKIRMGMVGGGSGAFIGEVHRMAAALDGQIELVCGAFSRSAENSRKTGQALCLDPNRCYDSYQQMFAMEAELPEAQRMDFVAIVTPNNSHFDIAKQALTSGFHVLSDKPATFNLQQAIELKELIDLNQRLYALTHTYTGYPMVKQAKAMIAEGQLGAIRKIVVEYPQGWLADAPDADNKQASWRLDPAQSGISCCMGDIGVHAANLAEYICGDQISQLCAELYSVVDGRELDDDGVVLLKFTGGAKGVLMASQISVGEENALTIRIYGEKAGLKWSQQEPNSLWQVFNDQPTRLYRTGVGNLSPLAQAATRTPAGHPEGYLEAFANIYRNFAAQLHAWNQGETSENKTFDVPGIDEAIRGMAFIENAVSASQSDIKWHPFSLSPKS